MSTIILAGQYEERRIQLNGRPLDPAKSQQVYNHSPDGFNWGYHGSGPAQLALAVMLELTNQKTAMAEYQRFKREIIAQLPDDDFRAEIKVDISVGTNGRSTVHFQLKDLI